MEFLSRFNPVPQFPAYKGAYNVGSFDLEIPVSSLTDADTKTPETAKDITTVQFRVFYPTSLKEPATTRDDQGTPGTVEDENAELEKDATEARGLTGWAASWFKNRAPPSPPSAAQNAAAKKQDPVYWLPEQHQREYVSGYARFLGTRSGLAELISYVPLQPQLRGGVV